MATSDEPFSYVIAELSERYKDEFPHSGIVPSYLETVSGKTGVEIVSGVASLAIRGSWLSLSRARSFLLTTYQKAEEKGLNNVDKDGERHKRNRSVKKRRCNSLDDDSFDPDDAHKPCRTRPLPADENIGNDSVSSWHKFTAEVLPQLQKTRSKRSKVYSQSKDKSQVPEPFVMVATFEPPSDTTAKKVPKLNDIERVLKKVYQKDGSQPTVSVEVQDSENAARENSEQSTGHEMLLSTETETDVNCLNSVLPSTISSGEGHGTSRVNRTEDVEGTVQVSASTHVDQSSLTASPTQLSREHCRYKVANTVESGISVQDSSSISEPHLVSLEKSSEMNEERVESELENSTAEDIVTSDTPPAAKSVSKANLASSDAGDTRSRISDTDSRRTSQCKGQPKKTEKGKEKTIVEKRYLKSALAERSSRRQKTHQKLGEISHTGRQSVTEVKSEHTPNKPKRGRPAKRLPDTEGEKDYQCSKCSYVAKKHSHLREHMRRVHITKEFSCDKCGKVFGFGKDLKRHQKTHQETGNRCDVCGKVYKGSRSLAEHKKVHADDYVKPEFPCEFCDKIFSTKYVLAYHIKSEHLGMKKTYICPICGKSFSQKNSYLQHANVHMGIRPHQCDVCGKSFSYEKSLKEHKYMHEEGKQFECPICRKKFRQTSGMSIHMKIHKEHKDYVCSACGKGFSQRQALVRHERIHGGEYPFSCGLCQRTFTDSSILRRHMILVHKKDPKKWREDTVSNIKKRTDFFISVVVPVGDDGETVKKNTSTESDYKSLNSSILLSSQQSEGHMPFSQVSGGLYGASQDSHSSDDLIQTDGAESNETKNEISVGFAPVSLAQPLQVPSSVSGLSIFSQGNSTMASISLPSMTTDNLSQSLVLSQRLMSEEHSISHPHPTPFPQLSSLTTQQSGEEEIAEKELTRPADMSAENQAEISTEDDGRIQAQSPSLISVYADHHRLNPSDFFSSDSDHSIHLPYPSLLHPSASIPGTFPAPVINSLLQNSLNALTFHSEPLIATSQSHEQSSRFEQLAGQNAMQESQYSPHNQNHQ